jgi:hypothetical protein
MSASTDALVAAKAALQSGVAQHTEAAIALIDAALAEDDEDTSDTVGALLAPAKAPLAEEAEETEDEDEDATGEDAFAASAGLEGDEPSGDEPQPEPEVEPFAAQADAVASAEPGDEGASAPSDGFNAS